VQKKEDEKKKKEEDAKKKMDDENRRKEESKYESHYIHIDQSFTRKLTGVLPYSIHHLNFLYYCIETYFPENSLTKDTVHTFVKEFEKYDSKSPEKEVKEMNKDDAILRLEAGINLFMMNESKTKLQEIVKRLNADPDELDNYLTPIQSLNKKCSSSMFDDSKTCFIFESLKQYEDVELVLLDEDNPNEKLKMSIFDFVENGARPKESWKNVFEPTIKSKDYYRYFEYVSKGTDPDSLVGFLCYYFKHNILIVSNIIWADNEKGKDPNLRNKLYDRFKDGLSGKFANSKLFIPDELNERVNVNVYKKGETNDGFTMWDAIVPPKPSVMESKIDAAPNQKEKDFLENLQRILLLFSKPFKAVKQAVQNTLEQTGGADNALLDEVINKYPSLKGLKSMIDDLPEDVQQKYASEIKTTLEKVKESNVPEIDLMNEPEFQEIQADLDAKILTKVENSSDEKTDGKPVDEVKTDGEIKVDEVKTDGDETKVDEVKTDGDETKVDEVKTDGDDGETKVDEVKTDGDETKVDEVKTDGDETKVDEVKTDGESSSSTTPSVTPPSTTEISTTMSSETIPSETSVTTTTPSETSVTTTTPSKTTDTTKPPSETTDTTKPPSETTDTTKPPSETSVTTDTTTTAPTDGVALKREDLKESPLLVHPTTGESGKYIFVPKDLVEKVIDFLLNNGCEVTTINLK
jgi:hypothetical protein